LSAEVADSAEEALRKIENTVFDLVLVDFKLPEMDRLQLIGEILKSKPQVSFFSRSNELSSFGSITWGVL